MFPSLVVAALLSAAPSKQAVVISCDLPLGTCVEYETTTGIAEAKERCTKGKGSFGIGCSRSASDLVCSLGEETVVTSLAEVSGEERAGRVLGAQKACFARGGSVVLEGKPVARPTLSSRQLALEAVGLEATGLEDCTANREVMNDLIECGGAQRPLVKVTISPARDDDPVYPAPKTPQTVQKRWSMPGQPAKVLKQSLEKGGFRVELRVGEARSKLPLLVGVHRRVLGARALVCEVQAHAAADLQEGLGMCASMK